MNYLIDLGNTSCKVAFEEDGVIGECHRSKPGQNIQNFIVSKAKQRIAMGDEIDVIVFSNVRLNDEELNAQLEGLCRKFILLDVETELPHNLDYKFNPAGMGADRIAGALAVACLFKGQDCIKFDFGTAITIDFINKEGSFTGGNISLGMRSRFKALKDYTRRLPYLSAPVDELPDKGVEIYGSMSAGIVFGIMFEVEGYINRYPDKTFIFTGGDAFYFAKKMKNAIFACPNLVLMGLAQIADYYAEKN